jgi:23S rRNA G2069 N7-methylase RlmK/C1962 C5-methylase RlmI
MQVILTGFHHKSNLCASGKSRSCTFIFRLNYQCNLVLFLDLFFLCRIVVDHSGNNVGWGMYNPDSMYRVRMLWTNSFDGSFSLPLDVGSVIETRLAVAKAIRSSLALPSAETDAYRLVNGEGDRLSGLVVDMYAGEVVISSSARWVEVYKDDIQRAVRKVVGAEGKSIWWRRSVDRLKQDGLLDEGAPSVQETVPGDNTSSGLAHIKENGITFVMDLQVF